MLEVLVGRDSPDAPHTTLWFVLPAIAILVLPIIARRWFPFADAAARIAVAEERVRIARELHDIVAHAVSVMVLQVGAVRHKLPEALAEDSDALRGVEQVGRTALAEMRGLLAAMRRDGEEVEFTPQPGLDGLDSLLQEVGRAGLPVPLPVD